MIERMRELFRDEEGATMVEYALLLGLIAVVAITALTGLGDKVAALFDKSEKALPSTTTDGGTTGG